MTQENMRNFAKLGFSNEESQEVVKHLNILLANYAVHYQKLRSFHWNVKGGDFFELHEKFEELYLEAAENIDELAERIRVFGKQPYSQLKDFLEVSEIQEANPSVSSDEMVEMILSDFLKLLSFMMETVEKAAENGDVGTTDLLNGMIRKIEKHHWMLSSFIENE